MNIKRIVLLLLSVAALANGILLQEVGFGANEEEAKKAALNALSRRVISSVQSSHSSKTIASKEAYQKTTDINISITSSITFQNIDFTSPTKANNQVKVTALIDERSMDNTIAYLLHFVEGKTAIDDSDKLAKNELYINQLYALSSYTTEYDSRFKMLNQRLERLKDLHFKQKNYGQILFVSDANITLDHQPVIKDELIFMLPGKYNYTATKQGCINEQGSVKVHKQSQIKKQISLVCDDTTDKTMALSVEDIYVDAVASALRKYQYSVDENSNNTLSITLKPTSEIEIAGMTFYGYVVYLEMSIEGRQIAQKTKLKNVNQNNQMAKMEKLIPLIIKAGLANL